MQQKLEPTNRVRTNYFSAYYENCTKLAIPTALSAAVAAPLPLERQGSLLTWQTARQTVIYILS